MKNKIFLFFLAIFIGVSAIFSTISISAQTQQPNPTSFRLFGKIMGLEKWKGWTVGNVQFLTGGIDSMTPVTIDRQGNLHWHFWIGTVGWVTFDHYYNDYHNDTNSIAKIECPETVFTTSVKDKNLVCPAKWYAWSESSGWISLDKDIHRTGNWVYFNPNSANLEWFGWSQSIGWVPMITSNQNKPEIEVAVDETNWQAKTTETWNETWRFSPGNTNSNNINLIGKVVAIGNTAGTKIFDIENAYWYHNQKDIASSYTTVQHANLFNQLRSTVAQMVRWIDDNKKNELRTNIFSNEKKFIYNEKKDYCIIENNFLSDSNSNSNCWNNYDEIHPNTNSDTIIVKWKDIIIDTNFVYNNENGEANNNSNYIIHPENMKWIIALKDNEWNWWNIYITENVSQIYAYIVAEWSIFSGYKDGKKGVSYIEWNKPLNSPNLQLYINWLLISKNTIGGNQQDSKCPILSYNCDETGPQKNSQEFDFNYFRKNPKDENWNYKTSLPESRKQLWAWNIENQGKIQEAIMIIDYNNNIITNPPIGFEIFR